MDAHDNLYLLLNTGYILWGCGFDAEAFYGLEGMRHSPGIPGFRHWMFLVIRNTIMYEPRHEISNNVVCSTSKTSDQPAHKHSLIRACASRLTILCLLSYWRNIIRVSKLKRRLQRLVWVCTCQVATLLEITCRGSIILFKRGDLNSFWNIKPFVNWREWGIPACVTECDWMSDFPVFWPKYPRSSYRSFSNVLLLWILFCYLCSRLSCLFLAALWSPAVKWLTSWFFCAPCFNVFWLFHNFCFGLGMLLDCIYSWSLPSSLLVLKNHNIHIL